MRVSVFRWVVVGMLLLSVHHARADEDDDDEDADEDFSKVTCGSVIKLQHVESKFRLHSHGINWGSGSGQQSVTAFESAADGNSLWLVKEGAGFDACRYGEPILCGQTVRLIHSKTKKHLHSHLHRSPLSHRQEISAYGDANKGESDTGDNWKIECADSGAKEWRRDGQVRLKHIDTANWLYAKRADQFNERNCRNCPIIGQLEVSAHTSADSYALWAANEGIYFPSGMAA